MESVAISLFILITRKKSFSGNTSLCWIKQRLQSPALHIEIVVTNLYIGDMRYLGPVFPCILLTPLFHQGTWPDVQREEIIRQAAFWQGLELRAVFEFESIKEREPLKFQRRQIWKITDWKKCERRGEERTLLEGAFHFITVI